MCHWSTYQSVHIWERHGKNVLLPLPLLISFLIVTNIFVYVCTYILSHEFKDRCKLPVRNGSSLRQQLFQTTERSSLFWSLESIIKGENIVINLGQLRGLFRSTHPHFSWTTCCRRTGFAMLPLCNSFPLSKLHLPLSFCPDVWQVLNFWSPSPNRHTFFLVCSCPRLRSELHFVWQYKLLLYCTNHGFQRTAHQCGLWVDTDFLGTWKGFSLALPFYFLLAVC